MCELIEDFFFDESTLAKMKRGDEKQPIKLIFYSMRVFQ